jgi:hypothetical protein
VLAAAALCAGLMVTFDPGRELTDAIFPAALALPLLLALRLVGERGWIPLWLEGAVTGLVIAGLIFFALDWREWGEAQRVVRYLQLSAAAHLLLAVGPFARPGAENAFWHFNRILLYRVLGAAVHAGALFLGLSAAILAVDRLFGVTFPDPTYFNLFGVLAFVFTTWYIVAGLPRNLDQLEHADDDPRALRLFAQFVLVPLCAVYLLILTAYLARVLLTQAWPSGWIGWLISCMAVAGILSVLLTRPFGQTAEGRWIVLWERIFWLAMLPATGMLLAAVGKRIQQYGVTEPRYFVIALGLWLSAMAVSYGIARVRSLKLIPASLALVALLTAAGPWGADSVAKRSQFQRLTSLLERNSMLEEGRAVAATAPVSPDDATEIVSTLAFLLERDAQRRLSPLLDSLEIEAEVAPRPRSRAWEARRQAVLVAAALEVREVPPPQTVLVQVSLDPASGIPVAGFDRVFAVSERSSLTLGGETLAMSFDREAGEFRLLGDDGNSRYTFSLTSIVDRVARAPEAGTDLDPNRTGGLTLTEEEMTFDAGEGPIQLRLVVQRAMVNPGPVGPGDPEDPPRTIQVQSAILLVRGGNGS